MKKIFIVILALSCSLEDKDKVIIRKAKSSSYVRTNPLAHPIVCGKGEFSNQGVCHLCPEGHYQHQPGKNRCSLVVEGFFAVDKNNSQAFAGAVRSEPCPVGFYCTKGKKHPLPPGYYGVDKKDNYVLKVAVAKKECGYHHYCPGNTPSTLTQGKRTKCEGYPEKVSYLKTASKSSDCKPPKIMSLENDLAGSPQPFSQEVRCQGSFRGAKCLENKRVRIYQFDLNKLDLSKQTFSRVAGINFSGETKDQGFGVASEQDSHIKFRLLDVREGVLCEARLKGARTVANKFQVVETGFWDHPCSKVDDWLNKVKTLKVEAYSDLNYSVTGKNFKVELQLAP